MNAAKLVLPQLLEKTVLPQVFPNSSYAGSENLPKWKQWDLKQRGDLNVAWRNVLMNATNVFFNWTEMPMNFTERIGKAWDAIVYNEDTPILSRHSLYSLLDQKGFGGGIFGSLGLDCVFTAFFSSMITNNSYVRIEHISETRPTVDGKPLNSGYQALIQDGPFKVRVHKCEGSFRKQQQSLRGNATQHEGCKQNGNSTTAMCTAEFTLDFHYCQEFEKDVDCYATNGKPAGVLMRKGIYSKLVFDRDQGNKTKEAECRPWFVLMDSGFRVGFSSIIASQTPWLMRRCLYPEPNPVLCIPGQKLQGGSCQKQKGGMNVGFAH